MSESNEWIELSRDCEAVMIPAGHTILLPKGTRAVICSRRGGSSCARARKSFGRP